MKIGRIRDVLLVITGTVQQSAKEARLSGTPHQLIIQNLTFVPTLPSQTS